MELGFVIETNGALNLEDLYLRKKEELIHIIRSLKEQVDLNNRRIDFLENVLDREGLKNEALEKAFTDLESYRIEILDRLDSSDEQVSTEAYEELAIKTSEIIEKLWDTRDYSSDRESYVEELKEYLTKEIWNGLNDNTRKILVTALFLFDYLCSLGAPTKYDFSAVCMLMGKALEIETTIRMRDNYIHYLQNNRIDKWRWPKELLISRNQFTLGKPAQMIGLCVDDTVTRSEQKEIIIDDTSKYNLFSKFFQRHYNLTQSAVELETKIKNDVKFIETVREKYRNPSSHKDQIIKSNAERCIDYMLKKDNQFKYYLKVR